MTMNNPIYCSTGAFVGRASTWDHTLIPRFGKEIEADGFEFMMEKVYYDKRLQVVGDLEKSGLSFPVIHLDKEIGFFLGGDAEEREQGLQLFSLNCQMGWYLGCDKAVLHLWSGTRSDGALDRNLSVLEELYKIAEGYRLRLLIENVPCAFHDPMTDLDRVSALKPDAKFVYDVRFGAFHEQNDAIVTSGALADGRIDHIHISDYVGPPHDFKSLRPIPHLGKGIIGLETLLPRIAEQYHGSLTLESPEILPDRVDPEPINRDLAFIRRYFL